MDPHSYDSAPEASSGEMLVELDGRTLAVEFRAVETNPLWIGDPSETTPLFHWICRLGGDDPIEFHHTQSWSDFDAATALGCLIADADDARSAGSFPDWSRLCGFDPDSDASEHSSRLARSYAAILGYGPRIDALRLPLPEPHSPYSASAA
jgi:hypothetical protein